MLEIINIDGTIKSSRVRWLLDQPGVGVALWGAVPPVYDTSRLPLDPLDRSMSLVQACCANDAKSGITDGGLNCPPWPPRPLRYSAAGLVARHRDN